MYRTTRIADLFLVLYNLRLAASSYAACLRLAASRARNMLSIPYVRRRVRPLRAQIKVQSKNISLVILVVPSLHIAKHATDERKVNLNDCDGSNIPRLDI